MTADGLPRIYTPEELATALPRSSEREEPPSGWWVRQQVREGRFPHVRGARGAIGFTREHYDQIIRLIEQRPNDQAQRPAAARSRATNPTPGRRTRLAEPVVELRARTPRRARNNSGGGAA